MKYRHVIAALAVSAAATFGLAYGQTTQQIMSDQDKPQAVAAEAAPTSTLITGATSTVEDQIPKDLFEYKKMKEAGFTPEFDRQSHRESSLAQLNTALRFVPYQYSRMEEYFPSALIDKAPSSYNFEREINPSLGNVSFKRVCTSSAHLGPLAPDSKRHFLHIATPV